MLGNGAQKNKTEQSRTLLPLPITHTLSILYLITHSYGVISLGVLRESRLDSKRCKQCINLILQNLASEVPDQNIQHYEYSAILSVPSEFSTWYVFQGCILAQKIKRINIKLAIN